MPILSSTSSKIHTLTNYISYPVVSFAIFDSMDVITLLFELFLLLFIKKYPKIGYSKYICIIFSYNTIDDSVQFLKQVSGHKRGVVSLLHWVCYRFLAHVCKRSSLYSQFNPPRHVFDMFICGCIVLTTCVQQVITCSLIGYLTLPASTSTQKKTLTPTHKNNAIYHWSWLRMNIYLHKI